MSIAATKNATKNMKYTANINNATNYNRNTVIIILSNILS